MKHDIQILPLADHYVVVAKERETHLTKNVFTLNASAAEMLTLFIEGHDAEAVARIIAERYGADLATVTNDVKSFEKSISQL